MVDVVVETGAGLPNSNSYISRALATSYFDTQLRADVWTDATDDDKDRSLIMATAQIDALVSWYGKRVKDTQALSWPRSGVTVDGVELESDEIPVNLQEATAEMAKALLTGDRMGDSDTAGFKRIKVDVIELEIDKYSTISTVPTYVSFLLAPLGRTGSGMVGVVIRS